jgi:hypothetical protein
VPGAVPEGETRAVSNRLALRKKRLAELIAVSA